MDTDEAVSLAATEEAMAMEQVDSAVIQELVVVTQLLLQAVNSTSATSPSKPDGKNSRTSSELLVTLFEPTSTWASMVDQRALESSSLLLQKMQPTLFRCTMALTGTDESLKYEKTDSQAAEEEAMASVAVTVVDLLVAEEATVDMLAASVVEEASEDLEVVSEEASAVEEATEELAVQEASAAATKHLNCHLPSHLRKSSSRTFPGRLPTMT